MEMNEGPGRCRMADQDIGRSSSTHTGVMKWLTAMHKHSRLLPFALVTW